jgi:hypothetical protein
MDLLQMLIMGVVSSKAVFLECKQLFERELLAA